jgi:hypothetical protein
LLTAPAPSGSPGTARLCRGCSRLPRRPADQAASSFTPPLRRQGDKGLPPPSGTDSASWRTTSSSTSLKARERLNRTSQPQSRTKMRYSKRRNTADHHGPPPTPAHRRSSEAMQTRHPAGSGEPENRPNLVFLPRLV